MAGLRTLSQAWLTYPNDNNDDLVNGIPEVNIANAPVGDRWIIPPSPSIPPGLGSGPDPDVIQNQQNSITAGRLYEYIETVKPYHCPSDQRQDLWTCAPWISFSITGGLNGVNHNGAWGIIPYTRYETIDSPSDDIVFMPDVDPRVGFNRGSWLMFVNPEYSSNYPAPGWVDPVGIWHQGRSNIAFADGHVGQRIWEEPTTLQIAKVAEMALYEQATVGTILNSPFYGAGLPISPEDKDLAWLAAHYPYRNLY